ncbi:unnamed protein product [Owenia fusiformis]|uniref:Purine nucleoside phosphorylase n=1 Tax=Owenia fusiformis TaxID=6347 RepID=A0A8J1YAU6_OWEFU|nr:unnamed protein product [Owenia fusiformis]
MSAATIINGTNGTNGQVNGTNGKNGVSQSSQNMCSYEECDKIAQHLLSKTRHRPKIGIICGSGLGGLAESVENKESFSYKEIPQFPVSTVPGHAGRLVFGKLGGKEVVAMQGRFHPYEGYPLSLCTLPVRVMKLMGVETLIVTNAAGGLNESYEVGDVMVIKDHINMPGFSGNNPLIGENEDKFGPRFPAMSSGYDRNLRKMALEIGKELKFDNFMHEGVYVMLGGPCFETIAECKLLRICGADVTGMSTVHEVIMARHCGMRAFGMSLVTNKCVMDYDEDRKANHEEVLETSKRRGEDMQKLVTKMIERIEV